jgi:hypothetical protein
LESILAEVVTTTEWKSVSIELCRFEICQWKFFSTTTHLEIYSSIIFLDVHLISMVLAEWSSQQN